ncbi:MAG: hypothetical protein WCK34_10255 [Bacteroidota bacterium]
MKKIIIILLLLLALSPAFAQVVYEDINNPGIYEFLDELANQKIITLNSAIKPYSRHYIAEKLAEAETAEQIHYSGAVNPGHLLNNRQRRELQFYLRDFQLEAPSRIAPHATRLADEYDYKLNFLLKKRPEMAVALNPLGFHYRDSLFTFSFRPILGLQLMTNQNSTEYRRWWGGSMFGYIGRNIGFYANIRDNRESVPLATPVYFTQVQGSVYKYNDKGGVDFAEMRGGLVASVKWGSIGLMVDRVAWGDNYHGANILSGKAPSFPYVQLHLNPVKWFDFNYMHGWLSSNVIDSSRSYYTGGVYRQVYRNKYIAANMYTITPWRGFNFSLGNSIIYSDINVNPIYLIPFLFYNPADASKNNYIDFGGSNSQLFFNISNRQINHLHIYLSLYIDEWKMSRLLKKNMHNFTSLKSGFRLSNFPFQNFVFTAEYTRTQPMTYDHYIPTTVFSSNGYVLGSYLRENSQELFFNVSFHPFRGLIFNASYNLAQHGDNVPYRYNAGYAVEQVPFLKNITWQNNSIELTARYEFVNNGYFFLQFLNSDQQGEVRYQPVFMHGQTSTFSLGLNVGF